MAKIHNSNYGNFQLNTVWLEIFAGFQSAILYSLKQWDVWEHYTWRDVTSSIIDSTVRLILS